MNCFMQVNGTKFSLCLVIGEGALKPRMRVTQPIRLERFIYGKIWEDDSLTKCVHYSRIATKGEMFNASKV